MSLVLAIEVHREIAANSFSFAFAKLKFCLFSSVICIVAACRSYICTVYAWSKISIDYDATINFAWVCPCVADNIFIDYMRDIDQTRVIIYGGGRGFGRLNPPSLGLDRLSSGLDPPTFFVFVMYFCSGIMSDLSSSIAKKMRVVHSVCWMYM